MKVLRSLILALALVLVAAPAFASGGADKARTTGELVLQSYKSQLKGTDYDFPSKEAFVNATLGESVPVFRFDATRLSNGASDLGSAMYDANLVEFAVNSNGTAVSRFTLKKDGDTYSRYQFGGLGESLTRGLATLSAKARTGARLVYLGRAEFLYAVVNGQEFLVSINPHDLPGITSYRLYTAAEVMPQLKALATDMVQHPDSLGGMGPGPISVKENTSGVSGSSTRLPWIMALAGVVALGGVMAFVHHRKTRA